ncbi:MAG TPA: AraC family transcriptional regulator [Cyclobacteriaceae bacterium]|nr:AraC family transcriptional regulator [Cyclobacteriaceae bacterium]
MQEFHFIIQIAATTLLGLVCILLARDSRRGHNAWTGVGFALSILCYLIVESPAIQSVPLVRIIISIGAIIIPIFFWLLARAIFDDHFKYRPILLLWFVVLLIPHLNFFVDGLVTGETFYQVSSILARLSSLSFVVAGVNIAFRTRQDDLVDERIRFRNIFLMITAMLIVVTLIVEVIPIQPDAIIILQNLQRSGIFAITLYFFLSNFGMRAGFFFKEIAKQKVTLGNETQLAMKLRALMEEEKIYKREGLTIGALAEVMNEQEYRLRRVINGELGFRNFNDFLNQYRVNDACEILSDPNQTRKTILEIAYDLGYQSIGPFNKAFKDLRGTTPTAYRKSQVGG